MKASWSNVCCVEFSSDNSHLILGTDRGVQIWDRSVFESYSDKEDGNDKTTQDSSSSPTQILAENHDIQYIDTMENSIVTSTIFDHHYHLFVWEQQTASSSSTSYKSKNHRIEIDDEVYDEPSMRALLRVGFANPNLVIVGCDHCIRFWDLPSNNHTADFPIFESFSQLAVNKGDDQYHQQYSPTFLTGNFDDYALVTIETQESMRVSTDQYLVKQKKRYPYFFLPFLIQRRLYIADPFEIGIWDAITGDWIETIPFPGAVKKNHRVDFVDICRSNPYRVATVKSNVVTIWNWNAGNTQQPWEKIDQVILPTNKDFVRLDSKFSPDCTFLATILDRTQVSVLWRQDTSDNNNKTLSTETRISE